MSWLCTDYSGHGPYNVESDYYDRPLDRETAAFLRTLPLLRCHALLFGLQDRIVRRMAQHVPDAAELFDDFALHFRVHRLPDYEDADFSYFPRIWCHNYQDLAEICLEKERDEIEFLIATGGKAA